jgi:hypothetical protein
MITTNSNCTKTLSLKNSISQVDKATFYIVQARSERRRRKLSGIVGGKKKLYGCVEVAFALARISIELLGDLLMH